MSKSFIANPINLVIFIVAVVFIIAILVSLFDAFLRSRRRQVVIEKGTQYLKACPVCGAKMHSGEVYTGVYGSFRLKSEGKLHSMAALRCERCGYTALFS